MWQGGEREIYEKAREETLTSLESWNSSVEALLSVPPTPELLSQEIDSTGIVSLLKRMAFKLYGDILQASCAEISLVELEGCDEDLGKLAILTITLSIPNSGPIGKLKRKLFF